MKKSICTLLIILFLLNLAACNIDIPEQPKSDTGITGFSFATLKSPLKMEVGDKKNGNFNVIGNNQFLTADIEFVSTDEDVVSFTYDKTALTTFVYYNIEAVGAGIATIYVQTKDGVIKSDEITVEVTGENETKELVSEEDEVSKIPDNDLQASIAGVLESLLYLSEEDGIHSDVKYNYETSTYEVKIWKDGLALLLSLNTDQENVDTLKDSYQKIVDSIEENVRAFGDSTSNITFSVLNDQNKENALFVFQNGDLIYDVTAE